MKKIRIAAHPNRRVITLSGEVVAGVKTVEDAPIWRRWHRAGDVWIEGKRSPKTWPEGHDPFTGQEE